MAKLLQEFLALTMGSFLYWNVNEMNLVRKFVLSEKSHSWLSSGVCGLGEKRPYINDLHLTFKLVHFIIQSAKPV